jgi:hypothetical protein
MASTAVFGGGVAVFGLFFDENGEFAIFARENADNSPKKVFCEFARRTALSASR